jgi:hypothetical protein
MDFSQYHSYNEKHPAGVMAQNAERFFVQYGKPFFISEYGTDWRGWKPETDPHLRALHQAVWSGAFTGAVGTGMSWWWESIHETGLHGHWAALAAFLRGTGVATPAMKPIRFEENDAKKAKAFGVATKREALLWLLDPAFDWPNGAMMSEPPLLEGAAVTVAGLEDGAYKVEWWDTLTGKSVASSDAAVTAGRVTITAPPFRADIAARIAAR